MAGYLLDRHPMFPDCSSPYPWDSEGLDRGPGRMYLRETLRLQSGGGRGEEDKLMYKADLSKIFLLSHSFQDKCEFPAEVG